MGDATMADPHCTAMLRDLKADMTTLRNVTPEQLAQVNQIGLTLGMPNQHVEENVVRQLQQQMRAGNPA